MWKSSVREMSRRIANQVTVAQATEEQRQVIFKRCIMTMNWSQEKYDCSTWSEREAERQLHAQSESLVSKPTPLTDHTLTDGVETESRSTAGDTQWMMWFVGWDVMLAALAG